ncbi:MAG: DUF1385 domain-containing protein [Clostridia bacterium]|nr:DUF1385 domain-containing protein [Clostridia bacterium]
MSKEENPLSCRLNKAGGEAVIEGVMMKAGDRLATACRQDDGKIVVALKKHTSVRKKHKILNLPILRGFINFIESMALSFSVLGVSAELLGDGVEAQSKCEKGLERTFGKAIYDSIMVISGVIGVVLAVLLFALLPNQIAVWTEQLFSVSLGIYKAVLCGVLRILIFIGYIFCVSLLPDIKRTFAYHGAEHKTIACYEAGAELTPENAKNYTRFHPRCGTSFMFVMLALSILVSLGVRAVCELWIGWDFAAITQNATGKNLSSLIYTGLGLLTLPLVMGVGFEFLMYAGKHNGRLVRWLSAPGLWMQRLTTKEPDPDQLEVAITAFKCALPEEFPDFDGMPLVVRNEYDEPEKGPEV